MVKPDVICVQPSHVDFPLWRHSLSKYRPYFDQIYVAFMNSHRAMNLVPFLNMELSAIGCTTITDTSLIVGHDWRSSAITKCLKLSKSKKVLFLEQDFIFGDEEFLADVFSLDEPLVGFKESAERNGRLHPAFMLVDRSLLEQSSLNFSAFPPQYDHFGKISEELELKQNPVYLEDIATNRWEHMAGLTHNYHLLMNNETPNHNIKQFTDYNKLLLTLDVPFDLEFKKYIIKGSEINNG